MRKTVLRKARSDVVIRTDGRGTVALDDVGEIGSLNADFHDDLVRHYQHGGWSVVRDERRAELGPATTDAETPEARSDVASRESRGRRKRRPPKQ